jgi:diguanylate cyclase (GGDEF)-like protein
MFTIYNNTNALPQNSVTCIHQDHLGYLWVGTEEGACRFDGYSWKLFNLDNGSIGAIWCMGQDIRNRYWFGTLLGVWCLELTTEGATWQNFTPPGLQDTFFYTFYRDDQDRLWFGARSGAYCLDLSGDLPAWRSFLTGNDNRYSHVFGITQDKQSRFWFATQNEIKVLELGNDTEIWQAVDLPNFLQNQPIISILADSHNRVWLGTTNHGAVWKDLNDPQADWITYDTSTGIINNYIISMIEDRQGRIWFGTGEGVSRLDRAGDWLSYTLADGLPHHLIDYIFEDRDGRFWFGTQSGGLACLDQSIYPRLWRTYKMSGGLISNDVTGVVHDSNGRFWLATRSGVNCFDEKENVLQTYTDANGLPHSFTWAVLVDRQERVWVATRNGLAFRNALNDTEAWQVYGVADGLIHEHVNYVYQDSQNRLWISTFGGVSCLTFEGEKPRWESYDNLPRTIQRDIYEDQTGRIWFATSKGAAFLDKVGENFVWGNLTTADGLGEDNIKSIFQDSRGWLWFGTQGNGLSRYDSVSDRWTVFNMVNGLPNNTVYAILEDRKGYVWFSTNRGVCRLNPQDETVITFDHTAGLANDECNVLAAHADEQGWLWFGTVGGLSVIEALNLPDAIPPCQIQIDSLKVMGLEQKLEPGLILENSDYDLIFEYNAVEFTASHRVFYRFRLIGLARDWSAPTTLRLVRYTNLHAGNYTFVVQAKNWGGQWSASAEYSFRVVLSREEQRRQEELQSEKEAYLRLQIEKQILEEHNLELERLASELQRLNTELQKLNIELERQAREDGLTALMNRRYFEMEAAKEFERAVRYQRPLTVVMVDIDNFKQVNDSLSHLIGDQVLKTIADILRVNRRANDIVARYGGEEMVLIFPETTLETAVTVCEKLRKKIQNYRWRKIHQNLKVTVSMGLAADISVANHEKLLALADERLYDAKRKGKNRVSY